MIDIIVDTVNICAMRCIYCGTRSNEFTRQELSDKLIKQILNAAKQENNAQIFFGGGLFFCHSKWQQLLNHNRETKANIIIDSPLTSLSLQSINSLPPKKYHYNLSISYWGVGATHDKLSGVDSFHLSENFFANVSSLQKKLLVSFVISKELINQLDELIAFIDNLPTNCKIYFHRLMPVGKALNATIPTHSEALCFVGQIRKKCTKNITFHHSLESNECSAGRKRLFINYNGDLFGCGWIKEGLIAAANISEFNNINIQELLTLSRRGWIADNCPLKTTKTEQIN